MEEPAQIIKLDEAVINRIAAGEVIQRPANALKEMIENSLDAKSTNIQITVKNGGLKFIQIQDNGTGIRKEDLEILCKRFTTSKLREYEDLNSIATYGFRGEALASISHVAHLMIQSKTSSEQFGYRASYKDGKLMDTPQPTAANQGTQINVEDLFYNMNVRKRALRSGPEEYQKISEVVGKYAIHNSSVGFGLKKFNENNDIRTPPNSNQIDNIRTIYGNLIARELIEVKLENDPFRFNLRGYMTNVNYSTKKFIFLLFINHRLVDCPSIRKCIDQVYSSYLPKNMHPFVYLSLELDPKNVDVNVHPTKHEVHFLHEDQIVEIITTGIETKLLGSNNSRMFYTQSKLPIFTAENIATKAEKDKSTANQTIYDKNLVRTDFSEQKLEKFFGAPVKRSEISSENRLGADEMVQNEKLQSDNEQVILDGESTGQMAQAREKNSAIINSSLVSRITRVECRLASILDLRKKVEDNCYMPLRELFAQHVFVGSIDSTKALVQHSTKLFLCNTEKIMCALFYQLILYNFQNFGIIKFGEPLPIFEIAMIALDLPETGWTPEDGKKEELAQKITEILTEKGPMLLAYFSMEIDDHGNLLSLPLLVEHHSPEISELPMYIVRLATEVDWETEKNCFHMFAQETAKFYCKIAPPEVTGFENWKWTVEHVFYPAIKDYFLPSKKFIENAAVLQIADLPNLYKVFERC